MISKSGSAYDETAHLLRFLAGLGLTPAQVVLDVGCGFGEKLQLLRDHGYNVVGVDVNQEAIRANLAAGFRCVLPEEFDACEARYDVILMSHIIEHFAPAGLLHFMDHYLDRLKLGGHLIILSPLLWDRFYDDFDHVKPYPPNAIMEVFCVDRPQAQFQGRNRLQMLDVAVRRCAFSLPSWSFLGTNRMRGVIKRFIHYCSRALYRISGGAIGCTNGWVGLFKKVGPKHSSQDEQL